MINKLTDGSTLRRTRAVALLACAAIMPMAPTAAVSAGTAGQPQQPEVQAQPVQGQPANLLASVVAPPPLVEAAEEPAEKPDAENDTVDLDDIEGPPTRESVFQAICAAGIQHPEIVMRQALLETGNFRGQMLMSRNNLFGFRTQSYLRFDKWQDSVAYYKRWQDRRYTDSSESYSRFLVRIRYATPAYPSHVMRVAWNRSCPS